MIKISICILVCLLMTGCAVKKEGIGFGSFTNKFQSIEFEKCQEKGCPEEVVIIGNVSAYRDLDNNTEKEYASYTNAARKYLIDGDVKLTQEEFVDTVKGWTMVQFFNIPLIGASYSGVLISDLESIKINYPTNGAVILYQDTGDLVAAKSNVDGLFSLEKKLCDRKTEYAECKERYVRGLFDAESGIELNRSFNKKNNGKIINTHTYEINDNH